MALRVQTSASEGLTQGTDAAEYGQLSKGRFILHTFCYENTSDEWLFRVLPAYDIPYLTSHDFGHAPSSPGFGLFRS